MGMIWLMVFPVGSPENSTSRQASQAEIIENQEIPAIAWMKTGIARRQPRISSMLTGIA
jgi:hypothetical protein